MNLYICTREGDAGGYAGRLRDEIARLESNAKFVDDIARADTILLLIGPRWVREVADQASRLQTPTDAVRTLVEHALRNDRRLVPVLIGCARFPEANDLPATLAALLELNAWPVSHQGFKEDVNALLAGMVRPGRKAVVNSEAAIEFVTSPRNVANWVWEKSQYSPVRFVVDGVDRGTVGLVGQSLKVTVEPGVHDVELHSLSVPKQVRTVRLEVRSGETARVMGSRNWLLGTISLERVK